MQRRLFLQKGGVFLGTLVLGARIPNPEPAEAKGKRVGFLDGDLTGGPLDGWMTWLSLVGRRINGLAFDPTTVGDTFAGLRISGRQRGDRVGLSFYSADDLRLRTPIGAIDGTLNGFLHADYQMDSQTGLLHADRVTLSDEKASDLAGRYEGVVLDFEGRPAWEGLLNLRRNNTFVGSRITRPGEDRFLRVAGRWGITDENRVYVSPTFLPIGENPLCGALFCCAGVLCGPLSTVPEEGAFQTVHPFQPYFASGHLVL
ncbi:MAG: hypothetical protein HY320_04675 [Armatimonadetes bacterium]|nr:hypothetical protein [Armatimonadota bacterium]